MDLLYSLDSLVLEDPLPVLDVMQLKTAIEALEYRHHLDVLKILLSNDETSEKLTENVNGTFVNLSDLPQTVLVQLYKYLKYVNNQQNYIDKVENQKAEYMKLLSAERPLISPLVSPTSKL